MNKPVRLVYCYDSADSAHRQRLERHLTLLRREQLIESWHEELIPGGYDVQETIRQQVRDADVLLLLVSADFLASDRCQTMVTEALLRHDDRRTIVCPVIVRPCDWRGALLGGLAVLPADGTPVTTQPNEDEAWLEVAQGLRCFIALLVAALPGAKPNPYRGLAAFQAEDQAVFFGREELTRQLWQALQRLHESPTLRRKPAAPRLFAVLGPSGSGKSSLVLAGLVPALRQQPAWGIAPPEVITFTPGEHPSERLAQALLPLLPPEPGRLDAARLDELEAVLRKPGEDGVAHGLRRFVTTLPSSELAPLLVIVDQFEEIYAQCKDLAEQDLFVALLLHAAHATAPLVSVVLTLRNDFLGETRRHRELNQAISRSEAHALVPVMSAAELRRAIALPAARAGHPIGEATTELLLHEARNNETALPLLEFALTRIWEGTLSGTPPAVVFRDIGGAGGALAGKAQTLYAELTPTEKITTQRALVRLVQLGEGVRDTRRRAPLRELCGRGQTEFEVLTVLRHFASENARLITLSSTGPDTIAEVTHEALFEHWTELRQWIDASRADRRFHDRAAEAARLWDEDHRRAGRLWRRPDLDLLSDYQKRKPDELTSLLTAFLQAAGRQQRNEKLLRWGSLAAVFITLIIAAATYITKEQQRASEARQRTREVTAAGERIRQQLLDTYVEQGRQMLLVNESPIEALLWLHRAQVLESAHPDLPDLLRGARYSVDATHVVLVGHAAGIVSATYSPDSRCIVTASWDETARVWNADTGQQIVALKGHTYGLMSATYSPDGKRIVTASRDKTARVWDASTGQPFAELKGHTAIVVSAFYSPDGRRILTASNDATARVWDAETGQQLTALQGHLGSVIGATYSPDGKRIATASDDATARVWDAATGRQLAELKGHRSRVNSVAYSRDGRRIVTASRDQSAWIWDAETGRQLTELKGLAGIVKIATYSPDGKRLLTASDDKITRVWDAQTGQRLTELKGHTNLIWSAEYSPDGKRIVTASWDKTARVWDANTGRQLAKLDGHASDLCRATYSPDGKHIVTASQDGTARVWEPETGPQLAVLKGTASTLWSAAYSPDGKRIVTASHDKTARVWDVKTRQPLVALKGHTDAVLSASYSPNGKRIVTTSLDKTARVWDAETGQPLVTLEGHADRVSDAKYSPDGQRIATASWDRMVRLWDAETGQKLAALNGHTANIVSVSYSPNGKRLVTASSDPTAFVWDTATGQKLLTLSVHASSFISATYSPDGQRIVTASADRTARVWDAETGRQLAELKGHTDNVWNATYSPDGKRIATASDDQTARLWDAETGRQVAELKGHNARFVSARYSPDGKSLLTASLDGTARLWDVAPETQTADQITRLIRCKVGARFEREDSNVILRTLPNPTECLPSLQPSGQSAAATTW